MSKIKLTDKEIEQILDLVRDFGGEKKVLMRRRLEEFTKSVKKSVIGKIRYKFNQSVNKLWN